MPWNSIWPMGSLSVKQNETPGAQNTAYIKDTMGGVALTAPNNVAATTDHFWDVAAGLNGHHRFMKLPDFAADPVIDNISIRGVAYAKTVSVSNTRIELFYKNNEGVYQVSPSFVQGTTAAISGSYINVVTVPANSYGDIFMWATVDGTANEQRYRTVTGFFRSNATTTNSWALANNIEGTSDYKNGLKFGNGSDAVGLDIRARVADASNGLTWNYRITYRAI